MIRITIMAFLLLSGINVWGNEVFIVSEAERQYQTEFENAAYEGMLKRGLLEAAMKEDGLTLTEADLLLREIARISSVCNVLGIRLYEPEFKTRVGQLVSEGANFMEIKNGVEKFLRDKVRSGEISEDNPFKPIEKGLEFSSTCLEIAHQPPIPAYSMENKTRNATGDSALRSEKDSTEEDLNRRLNKLIVQAEELIESGNKSDAKHLFLAASYYGHPEAHFQLAYRYVLSPEKTQYHLEQAAVQGHKTALELYIDKVFFRAGSIENAQPHKAAAVYTRAKLSNNNLTLNNESEIVETLMKATEVPLRDKTEFFRRYGVQDEDGEWPFYDIWELAEKASRGGEIFGEPDPELVFWLIIHGGRVPAELESAVSEYYRLWKADEVQVFDLCRHVTSGSGATYCASRRQDTVDEKLADKLSTLGNSLSKGQEELLREAFAKLENFAEKKAQSEEMHGGTARLSAIISSIEAQKRDFISFSEKIIDGSLDIPDRDFKTQDEKLNNQYKYILKMLEQHSHNPRIASPEDFRDVQRQWIAFRDATSRFYNSITQSKSKKMPALLSYQRNKDFEELIENLESAGRLD